VKRLAGYGSTVRGVTDWLAWHAEYEDPESALGRRLIVVRELLNEAVSSHDGEQLRVLSVCAGDGRDVIPILARWRVRKHITGRLLESEPRLVGHARDVSTSEGLDGVEAACCDAAQPANYAGAIPADLVVMCGVFGNISDDDVERLIGALPAMCAGRANVVWTRHRRSPDLTPDIRHWFALNGFVERAFVSPGPELFSVGRHEMVVPPKEMALPNPLFTFVR
jgi:hypothetical protein